MARMQDPIQPTHPYQNCNCDELPLIDDTIERLDQLHLSAGYNVKNMHCSGACRYSPTVHSYPYPYQPFQKMNHSINTDKANNGEINTYANPTFDLNRPLVSNLTAIPNSESNYRENTFNHNCDTSVKCISPGSIEGSRSLDLHVANLSLNDQTSATNMTQNIDNGNKPVMLNMAKAWLEQNQGKEIYKNITSNRNNGEETESFNPNYQDDTTPDELASYMEHYLYLPKPMSSAAEMSYS